MDITANEKKENGYMDNYKESIRKALTNAIAAAIEEENLKLAKELTEVRAKAINAIAQERKAVIAKIVEDEKKAIWTKTIEVHSPDLNPAVIKDGIAKTILSDKPAESIKPAEVPPGPTAHAAPAGHTPALDTHTVINPVAAAPAPAVVQVPTPVTAHVPAAPASSVTAHPASVTPAAAAPAAHAAPVPTQVHTTPVAAPAPRTAVYSEKVELEILPPRDQKEIEIIQNNLNQMPEISILELVTQVEKSIFKVTLNSPLDLVAKLSAMPQILKATEVREAGKTRIIIYLTTKLKQEKTQTEMNSKVNKIFGKKR